MERKTFEQIRQDEVNELISALESKGGVVRFVSEIPENADEQTDIQYIQATISISVLFGGVYQEVLVDEAGLVDDNTPYVVVRDLYNGNPVEVQHTLIYSDVMFSHLARIADVILNDNAKKLENILEVTK